MATKANAATSETFSSKWQTTILSSYGLGGSLFFTILTSFNAGMFTTLGLRHGSASHESLRTMFLAVGCLSLLVAVRSGVFIFKRAAAADPLPPPPDAQIQP
jgi:hypothetical protein